MLDLLHARLRNFDFPLGCLLDERVQHDDAAPNQRARDLKLAVCLRFSCRETLKATAPHQLQAVLTGDTLRNRQSLARRQPHETLYRSENPQ